MSAKTEGVHRSTPPAPHDCLLYRESGQKIDLTVQRALTALREGERVLLLMHEGDAARVLQGVQEEGVECAELCRRGTLLVRSPEGHGELAHPGGLGAFLAREVHGGDGEHGSTLIVVDSSIWSPSLQHEGELDLVVAAEAAHVICLYQLTGGLPATKIVHLLQRHRQTIYEERAFGALGQRGTTPSEMGYLQEAFSLLLDNEDEAVYLTDASGHLLLFNRAAAALFGSSETMRGRPVYDLFPPSEGARIRQAEGEALASGTPVTFRLDSAAGGEARSLLVTAGAFRDCGAGAGCSFGIIRDMTELVQTKRKLKFTAHLVNVIGQAVIATDRRGTIIFWNRAAEELYGWKAREVLGRNVIEVTTSRISREQGVEIMGHLADGESWSGEFFVQRRDGSEFLAHVTDAPIRDDAGRLIGVIGVSYDISERKEAEEALAASEERFRRYFELGLVGMAVTTPDRRIIEVNDKACELLGYRREELLLMTWTEITHPDDISADLHDFQKVLDRHSEGYTLEKRFIRKDGAIVETIISVSCLRRKDGSIDSFLALLQDITDRKRAETEIAAYQQQLRLMAGEMYRLEDQERKHLASVLHDQIGQNLALSKMKLESLTTFEDREVLRQEIGQISALLDDIIKNTRSLTSELRPPVLHELGLEAAVESLCEEFQEQTGLQINYHAGALTGPLPDPLRTLLFQGVRELLVNVMKHAKASYAEVSITRKGSKVTVTVEDDGIGFDAGMRRFKGSFGLFSLRERLRHRGGSVDVDSAPGQGTRVELTVPLEVPGEEGSPAPRSRVTTKRR